MKYKKNYLEVLGRLNELYTFNGKDKIYAKMNIPNMALDKYKKDTCNGMVDYPDLHERIAFWDEYLSAYKDLEDDAIPCAYMSELDEGLYGALVGAEIKFLNDTSWGWVSSMVTPFVKDIKEFRRFRLDEDNIWFKRYKEQVRIFAERAEGKFGISHFIVIDSLNFLIELRGATNAYYDMIDSVEDVNYVIDFAERLNLWIHKYFFETVGLFNGGTCSNLAQWLPGKVVSESVDPFHLMSPETFEEWGKMPIERMFGHFDGGIVHVHSNGHHLIEKVSALKGLKCIALLDEPFNPPVYEKLESLVDKRGGIPFHISMPFGKFVEKLSKRELPTNVFYDVLNVPDIKTANSLMNDVRKYSKEKAK